MDTAVLAQLKTYLGNMMIYKLWGGYKDREYQIFAPPDGICDLESHINQEKYYYISNSIAIRRFYIFMKHNRFMNDKSKMIVDKYIDNFVKIKWQGRTGFEKGIVFGPSYAWWFLKRVIDELYNRIFHRYTNILNTDFYMTAPNPKFCQITKDFVDEFFTANGATSDIVGVDQLFPAADPIKYFKYVNDPYCIVVDRDPRDIYLEAKRMNVNLIPMETVENFVEYFKLTRPKLISMKDSRVLRIRFEDLIYRYEEVNKHIANFIGIKKQTGKKQKFNPAVSMKNTKLYLSTEYESDIRYIESNLVEYLYG